MNHANYAQRVDFIHSVLFNYKLEATKIETIEYDPDAPYPYNNFIYLVTLASPSTEIVVSSQFGTSPIPAGTTSLVFRLSNDHPGTGLNNTNRVENEVAFISLVRKALLGSKYSQIVPNIYSWASVSSGQGYTMQQFMSGTMPDKVLDTMSLDEKTVIRSQIAEILALMQKLVIPDTVNSLGGLTFDKAGNIISAQMTILKGGPFDSYEDLVSFMFESQLKESDDSVVIDGWKPNGTRGRIDAFVQQGLEKLFDGLDTRKVLVHSDFTTNNFLFNAQTLQITAILDFDFSCIATTVHEYAGFSFTDVPGGKIPGPFDASQLYLRKAILAGFPDNLSTPSEKGSLTKWEEAKVWYTELACNGATVPQSVRNFEKVSNAFWLCDNLCPFLLSSEFAIKQRTTEQLAEMRQEREGLIVKFLEMEGF